MRRLIDITTLTKLPETIKTQLDEFVYHHPHGNFFQSPRAFRFFESVDHYEPYALIAFDGGTIVGSLIAVFIKEGTGIKGYFSRRCIVWGGPLVLDGNENIIKLLLNALIKISTPKAIYTEFRNFIDRSACKIIFKSFGFQFNQNLNYIVTIDGLENVRQLMSESKRRQINKGLKNGAEIIEAESIDQVREFYAILSDLYHEKVKKPLPKFNFFESFYTNNDLGLYLLVRLEGKIIGGIMCPVYRDTIYEWYVCGLDTNYHDLYPSVLSTWAPIDYAVRHGYRYFDFMGAGKPEDKYGVRQFKSQFGGELVNYGRFLRVENKCLYVLGKVGLRVVSFLKH